MTPTWPLVFSLLAVGCTTAYVLGCAQVRNWQITEIRHVVDRTGRLNTNLQALYEALDYRYPAEEEFVPEPSWWQRRRAGAIQVPDRGPEPEPGDSGSTESNDACPDCAHPFPGHDHDGQCATCDCRIADEPFEPDPEPATAPIRMPPATVPSHEAITPQAIAGDEWERKSKAMLAEFEARMKELR